MKKIYSFALATSLLALGSCASDAPEQPGTSNSEGDAYVAVRISQNGLTRADEQAPSETVASSESEENIKSVTLFILDKDGRQLRRFTTNDIAEINGDSYAYFAITSFMFDDLKATVQGGSGAAQVQLKVYANAQANGATIASYNNREYYTGNTWTANQFLMTGENNLAYLSAPGEGKDGSSKANAWLINAGGTGESVNVNLTRLATRFDMENVAGINDGEYTATEKGLSNLKITIEGVAIHTHEASTFWWAQTPTEGVRYTVNPDVTGTGGGCNYNDGKKQFKTFNYNLVLPGVTGEGLSSTVYAHPHTVTADIPVFGYQYLSFAAVKCSFTYDKIPADATEVYAHNGYLLGTFEQFKNKELDYSEYPDTEKAWIAATQNSTSLSVETLKQAATVYEKEGDKFYCYYNMILTNVSKVKKEDRNRTNTAIIRNTCYKISVNSIAKLGYDETDVPHDEVEDQMLYIDMQVSVLPWVKNTANTGVEL
ncbi:MAG: fimbria major subunit [Bacteroides sp.]|nr:fimbria major subunit [Bacteroides sp.]